MDSTDIKWTSKVNYSNEDGLQMVCLLGAEDFVYQYIKQCNYSKERIILAYELLGSTFVANQQLDKGMGCWRKATLIRQILKINKNIEESMDLHVKVTEFHDYDALFQMDPEQWQLQALVVAKRILGPDHKLIHRRMMQVAYDYYDRGDYTASIILWKKAMEGAIASRSLLDRDTYDMAWLLLKFFQQIDEAILPFAAQDIMDSIEVIAANIPMCVELLSIRPVCEVQTFCFDTCVRTMVILLYYLTKLSLRPEEELSVKKRLSQILKKYEPKNSEGDSLLHQAIQRPCIADVAGSDNLALVKLLLECGADVNGTNHDKCSPLYTAVTHYPMDTEVQYKLIIS